MSDSPALAFPATRPGYHVRTKNFREGTQGVPGKVAGDGLARYGDLSLLIVRLAATSPGRLTARHHQHYSMRRRQQCGASRAHVPRTSSSRELRGLRPTIVSLLRLPAPMLSRRRCPRSHVAIAASGCGGDSDAEAESPPVDLANQKKTFVSPIHGFSFRPFEWRGLTAATRLWDPVIGPLADTSGRARGCGCSLGSVGADRERRL